MIFIISIIILKKRCESRVMKNDHKQECRANFGCMKIISILANTAKSCSNFDNPLNSSSCAIMWQKSAAAAAAKCLQAAFLSALSQDF